MDTLRVTWSDGPQEVPWSHHQDVIWINIQNRLGLTTISKLLRVTLCTWRGPASISGIPAIRIQVKHYAYDREVVKRFVSAQ